MTASSIPLCKRRVLLPVVITALLLATVAGSKAAEVDYAQTVAQLERLVDAELERGILTGVSIALVDDQRIVFSDGFGFADEKARRPATRETVYRAGSISKLFTALATMQLVERDKLDIDRPVTDFWPEFRIVVPFADAGPITLRQLMCHRSGLVRESPVGGYFDPNGPSIGETVASLADCVLAHRPGTVTKYSNAGVTVVGHVVSEVSGEDFCDYQRKHVLGPIGMKSSGFLAKGKIRRQLSTSYMQVADGRGGFRRIESPRFELGTIPAGNLYTTADDLGRFLAFLFAEGSVKGKQIVKPETLATMFTPQLVDAKSGFGLGFHVDQFRSRKRIGHSGAVYGFSSSIAGIPELQVGVVVLANEDIAGGPVRKLATAALGWMVDAQLADETPPEEKPDEETSSHAEPLEAGPFDAEPFAGHYESAGYWARIEPAEGGLAAVVSGQRLKLIPDGPDKFRADGRWTTDAPFEFSRDDDDRVMQFKAMRQTFRRVDPDAAPETPEAWQAFLGSYGPEFIPLIVSIRYGHLYAMTENMVDYRLTPLNRTVFKMSPGMYLGEELVFQPDADGRVHSAVLAGMVLRRIEPE